MSKPINTGGPAFPITPPAVPAGHYYSGPAHADGLTKREYFAGHVLAGMAMRKDLTSRERAIIAVSDADALLAELAKGGGDE
jgi:hypothetical protein